MLRIIGPVDVSDLHRESAVSAETLQQAAQIVERVRRGGEAELPALVNQWDRRKPTQQGFASWPGTGIRL